MSVSTCMACWVGKQHRRPDGTLTDCNHCGKPGPKPDDYEYPEGSGNWITHYVNHGNTWQTCARTEGSRVPTIIAPEDFDAYESWEREIAALPMDVRMSLVWWILRSVVAPKEHYGKDAADKPEVLLSLHDWIDDKTGIDLRVLFQDIEFPSVAVLQRFRPPSFKEKRP